MSQRAHVKQRWVWLKWRVLFALARMWIALLVLRCWLIGGDHRALRLALYQELEIVIRWPRKS